MKTNYSSLEGGIRHPTSCQSVTRFANPNPVNELTIWNPIETHQGTQRYQFIYLMSQHFSSTILNCESTSALSYAKKSRRAPVESILRSDEALGKIYSSYHIKFYCHLWQQKTTSEARGERRRQKPFDHLIHLILSIMVGAGVGRWYWVPIFILQNIEPNAC